MLLFSKVILQRKGMFKFIILKVLKEKDRECFKPLVLNNLSYLYELRIIQLGDPSWRISQN